jgi:hypothetical protein
MSLATWKKEFYGPMSKAVKSKKSALAHSLKKWEGLTKGNLKKHALHISDGCISDEDHRFEINGDSCALCCKYWYADCVECPLTMALGHPCYAIDDSPFRAWYDGFAPGPMIRALKKAIKAAD